MRSSGRFLLGVWVWSIATGGCEDCSADEPAPAGVLSLSSGDTIPGRFRPSSSADVVRWHAAGFTRPFEFETALISSIRLPAQVPPVKPRGEFSVELTCGDVVTGRFTGWSDETVRLASTHFGEISINRGSIRRLSRLEGNPKLVFPSLAGLTGWKVTAGQWREDGTHVWTDADEAVLTGDLGIPEQAVIEFELSWTGIPNFVLALGVDPASAADDREQGWRLEAWNLILAAVREQSQSADVAHLQDLQQNGRIHLIAYLDRPSGQLEVFHADGARAGKIAVKSDAQAATPVNQPARRRGRGAPAAAVRRSTSTSGGAIRLINRHGDIRLERLRVARWSGVLPSSLRENETRIEFVADDADAVRIVGLDGDARHLVVRQGDQERRIPLEEIATAELPASSDRPSERTAALLQDGTRVSGTVSEIGESAVVIRSVEIAEPLVVPLVKLRTLSLPKASGPVSRPKVEGRRGRLELGEHRSSGRLVAGSESPETHCFVWQPDGSRTSSPLEPGASGCIVYRESPPVKSRAKEEAAREARALQVRRLGGAGNGPPEPNFFARLFLKKADEAPKIRTASGPQSLHLRSGDVVTCTVTSIDKSGVAIESPVTGERVIPHSRIKAIELDGKASPPDLQEAKKQRLLTLPRLQAASPPTHLLCSRTGDFLRCRLLAMNAEQLRVEVQLAEIEVPRDRVAQIIWFHEDERKPTETPDPRETDGDAGSSNPAAVGGPGAAPDFRRLAQVIQRGGKRVTFDPVAVDEDAISGVSEVLGECRILLDEIDQLSFGERIRALTAELAYHQWRLHPAVLPRVAQDLEEGREDSGTVSPLVGQPAPEIDLELLGGGGERFKLSEQKGRIVVLDFWATWCGPCMQTMPLLEEAMREYDPAQVRFVSVNLEERADHVQGVLERHGLNATVALDIDGVAARRYEANAIPQLVIVDREGIVSRVYVGGGRGVVEQLTASLTELLEP